MRNHGRSHTCTLTNVWRCGHFMKFYGYHKIVKFAKQTISWWAFKWVWVCACVCVGAQKWQFSFDFIISLFLLSVYFSLRSSLSVCVWSLIEIPSHSQLVISTNLLIYALGLWVHMNFFGRRWIWTARWSQQIVMAEWQRNDWT